MSAANLTQHPSAPEGTWTSRPARLATASDRAIDDLAWLASQICCAPMALITLQEGQRHRPQSRVGLTSAEAAEEWPFLPHVAAQGGVFQVTDASDDERFANHPQVRAKGGVRFFAGV